ncbi:hypothetical protein AB0K09_02870 [Streptomyces sp. NPDC049577]|uniref:hypothetical protein n=1 Tax=Streptomyces sp. NPDC049577 TaxID=3155153 RepID=UPI003446BB66
MLIRRETPADVPAVRAVTAAALARAGASLPVEVTLLDALRGTRDAWLPALSLVAAGEQGQVVGHVVRTLTAHRPELRGTFAYAEPFRAVSA